MRPDRADLLALGRLERRELGAPRRPLGPRVTEQLCERGGGRGPIPVEPDRRRGAGQLFGFDVDVDDRELARLVGPAKPLQLEPAADADQHVGLAPALESLGAAETEVVVAGDDPAAAAKRDDRRLQQLGQLEHLAARVERAAADHDHRVSRPLQQVRGALERGRVGERGDLAGVRVDERNGLGLVEHLPGHFERHRAWSSARGLAERLGEERRRRGRVLDAPRPLGQGAQRRQLVRELVQVPAAGAEELRGHLAGQADDRGARGVGGAERRARVQHARPGDDGVDPWFAGRFRVAERHVGGRLLVTRADDAERAAGALEGVEQAVDLRAGQREHGVHLVPEQRRHDRVTAGHRRCGAVGRHRARSRLLRDRPASRAAFHHARRRDPLAEAELGIERLRVAGVEPPAQVAVGTAVDDLAHQREAEPLPAVRRVDEHVGEIGQHRPVGDRAREADLSAAVVEPDHAQRAGDRALHHLARATARPVGLQRQVAEDVVEIDPRGVVVELVSARQLAAHLRRARRATARPRRRPRARR